MFNNQQENTLFQEKDALKEWDFSCTMNDEENEEKCAKIFVKYDKCTKNIDLPKSTLTMEYSINDLIKIIKKEFKLSNHANMKIFYDNKTIMVNNDKVFQQILGCLNNKPMEIEIFLSNIQHCLLCMKSNCHHISTITQKKRKEIDSKPKINLLEPELNYTSHPREENSSPISACTKKRRIASCSQSLKSSQNLLIPQSPSGSFIF
eukprot:TRINITY_DN309_c1_g1_i1.p1 TRINITY_DN309_c1_g1~~TRINITY_DN309_c1_g1_i1.p1  ORF type:complete len:206 (-),score=59.70 TRINITY_DN309_c1_g1_i1:254-871(-)